MYGRAAIHISAASGKEIPLGHDGTPAGNGGAQESWYQPAGELFLVLVSEIAQRNEEAGHAWIATSSTPSSESISQWHQYRDQVAQAVAQGGLSPEALQVLIRNAPDKRPDTFNNFANILQESDRRLFFSDLLSLGRQLHDSRGLPVFTEALLTWCEQEDGTGFAANQMLAVRRGEAGWGARFEYEGAHLISELANPMFLVPFGLASLSARSASLAVLSRASRWQGTTLLASETAALAAEVPTLVFSRRLGLQLFSGGSDLWDSGSLSQELLATVGPFALLRGTGNAFNLFLPRLQKLSVLRSAGQETAAASSALLASGRATAEVGAVMGGHYLNGALGVEPMPSDGTSLLFSSLLTVGHMRLAGGVVERLNPLHLGSALSAQHYRLRSQTVRDFHRSLGVEAQHSLFPRLVAELSEARGDLTWGDLTLARWTSRLEQGRNHGLAEAMESQGMSLHALLVPSASPQGGSPLDTMAFGHRWVLATGSAGRGRGGSEPFQLPSLNMMISSDSENGAGGSKRSSSTETPIPESDVRTRLMYEEVQRRVIEITEEAANDNSNTRLQNAASKLNGLWERYIRNSQNVPPEEITRQLEEVREEIEAARNSGTKLQRLISSLRLFVEQIRRQQPASEPGSQRPDGLLQEETLVPEEPESPFQRYLLNPIGRVLVGFRDLIKGRSSENRAPDPQNEAPPESGQENRFPLDQIAEEIARKEAQGEDFEGAVKQLARFRRYLYFASRSSALTAPWRSRLNDLLEQLADYFPNLNWPRIGMEDLSSVEIQAGQQGALLGLAVRPDWLNSDSPLAWRLRGTDQGSMRGDNRALELLHQSILFGANYNGILKRFEKNLQPLAQEYGANETQTAAMRLTGEAVAQLMRNKWSLENLLENLQGSATGSPLEGQLNMMNSLLPQDVGMHEAMARLGGRDSAESYFLTGLYVALKSQSGAIQFHSHLLPEALKFEGEGFHPSIPVSLFGAARGRGELFADLFPKGFDQEAYLERALREAHVDGE